MIALLTGCNRAPVGETHEPAAKTQAAASEPPQDSVAAVPGAMPASEARPADSRPVIVAFGDSLTAGYGTGPGESYPDFLQHDLDARGYRYRVVNAGVSGNTTKDGVERVGAIAAEHPAVAIVAFGGNDGLRGIPIHDTETNLRTIVATLEKAHVHVILGGITLPPNYGSDYIARFNAIYAKLARDYHVPLLPFLLKDVYGVPGDMQQDGIHATAQGNRQVAKNFLPLLLPLLHPGRSERRGGSKASAGHP